MSMTETNKCPVCGKNCAEYAVCHQCNWENDPIQRENPDFQGGANNMSLNEAREAYKNGEKIH